MRFVDGTCIDLIDGCDELADFTFTTLEAATAASVALQNQVFVDGPSGAFDTDPELTNGCSNATHCVALTPFEIPSATLVNSYEAPNWIPGISSDSYVLTLNNFHSTEDHLQRVYARWQPSPTTVPLSSTPVMLLIVTLLVGTGFARTRRDGGRAAH